MAKKNTEKCPNCGSENTELVEYMGLRCLVCGKCGYDERNELETTPQQRETQREKRRYSPYRRGGRMLRSVKRG